MGRILQFSENIPRSIDASLPVDTGIPQVHEMLFYCEDQEGRLLLEPLIFDPNARIKRGSYTLEDAMQFCNGILSLPGYRFEKSVEYQHDWSDEGDTNDQEVLTFVVFAHKIPGFGENILERKWTAIFVFAATGDAPMNYGDTLFHPSPNR